MAETLDPKVYPRLVQEPSINEKLKQIATSEKWLRLLHFERPYKPGQKSLVDGGDFFMSPVGDVNPYEELVATLNTFGSQRQVGKLKQVSQCSFPERYRYLQQVLNFHLTKKECPLFDEFMARFQPQSVSLVFSSAMPNNPASMFGHTFLKINSENKNPLLDQGINYAARVPPDENPFAFIYFGIFGGYTGQFSAQPYYEKVNEYIHSESRDLWEYELSLSPEETKQLLAHVWELETNAYFWYYFFDENCSYQLLSILEAVRTDWNLTDFKIYVIPGESVKKVTETPGAVKEVHYRPSLQKQMLRYYDSLSSQERHHFFDIQEHTQEIEKENSSLVLETVAKYIQYKRVRDGGKASSEDLELQQKVLLRRSQISDVAKLNASLYTENTRPDLGHDAYRVGLVPGISRFGESHSTFFQELQWKSAYHDLLNKDIGYSRNSHIDFPGVDLRYDADTKTLFFEKVTGIETTSLFPLSFAEQRLSWKFSGYSYTPKDLSCRYCHVLHFDGGVGGAVDILRPELMWYALLTVGAEVGDSFAKGYRLGPGLQSYFIYNPTTPLKFRVGAEAFWEDHPDQRADRFYTFRLEQSYSLERNWELRTGFSKIQPNSVTQNYEEFKIQLYHYYN